MIPPDVKQPTTSNRDGATPGFPTKGCTVTVESYETVASLWRGAAGSLRWDCLFVLPPWLKTWWRAFGSGLNASLCAVRREADVVGLAPLVIEGEQARLMGSADVCDFLDCVTTPGKTRDVLVALIAHLRQQGVAFLDLGPLHAESVLVTHLAEAANEMGCECSCRQEDVTVELELPATWDAFLYSLSGKERHEIRRKFRRLHEAGRVVLRVVEEVSAVREEMDAFLALFAGNRADKAAFMTGRMASFFRALAEAMAAAGLLRLSFLELDGETAAAVMCFDYNSAVYLYNNGYDTRFSSLSVGLLSKVLTIKDSIDRGRRRYDFLKGSEPYKLRLGGRPVPVYRCRVRLR